MSNFKIGEKVRIKKSCDWTSDAGQRFAGMTGEIYMRINRVVSEEPEALSVFKDVLFSDEEVGGKILPPTFPAHIGPGHVYTFHEDMLESVE